jgi:uncharacterized protein (TIGR03435 family)
VPEILRALLAERFGVRLHRASKEFPVYALVPGNSGPKLKESAAEPEGDKADPAKANVNVTANGGPGGTSVSLRNGSSFSIGDNKLRGVKLTMAAFADVLARYVDRPVVDMTDLKGNYDMTIEFTPEDFRAMTIRGAVAAGVALPPEVMKMALQGSSIESVFSGVQLPGLGLERRKAPLEVLVIDQMTKTPSAN